ncbi:MAG: methyl-accepting chemotaxis protein [Candidatus Omnitrophica bacterium]|nr:methyl-accepting chemotaxis protein [Candidatus Omnitrophota bacterium]
MLNFVTKSIGLKLTTWLTIGLICILSLITVMNIVSQDRTLLDGEKDTAKKLSNTVYTAIWYPMLTGDQDVIQRQFDQFAKEEGVIEMELINDKGVIKRSTDRSSLNRKFDSVKQAKEKVAHVEKALAGEGVEFSGLEERQERKDAKGSAQVFTIVRPIKSDKACLGCHPKTLKVLGALRIVLDWTPVEQTQQLTKWRNIALSVGGLLLMGVLVVVLMNIMLSKPVGILIGGTLPLAAGDLTQKISIRTQDELGRLGDAFNKIVNSLHGVVSQVRNSADRVASSAEEMSSSTEEMNATTQEVSAAIQKVSKGATTQAERLQETFETLEKTAQSIKQMVSNAQAANQAVSDTNVQAESSKGQAREAVEKIERLTNTVGDTAKVIQALGQMSQQIGEITVTITSIADQTNLLALNAAIEAARAGEAGRGFAVVAEEVRKLAEGSAEAVRKIGGLIRSIQSETNRAVNAIEMSSKEVQEGMSQVAKIAEVLAEISKVAQNGYRLTNEIAEAGQNRIVELERLVKAVNEVTDIAKESASTVQEASSSTEEQTASMEEMSASAQEFARLAIDLKEVVGKFKLDEGNAPSGKKAA